MGGNVWLNLLGSGAIVTIIVSVINAMFNRRKLGADTTKVITDAAAGTLRDLREDYARVRTENAELRAGEDKTDAYMDSWRRTLQLHAAWDSIAVHQHPDLPECPPLTPPERL